MFFCTLKCAPVEWYARCARWLPGSEIHFEYKFLGILSARRVISSVNERSTRVSSPVSVVYFDRRRGSVYLTNH